MNESQMHFFLANVARYKSYIPHDSPLFHFGKGKTVGMDGKLISDAPELGTKGEDDYKGV